jgi:hypothetical protein
MPAASKAKLVPKTSVWSRRITFLVISFLIIVAYPVLPQRPSALSGTVVTKDDKPVAAVAVVGSIWKDCCPAQRDKVNSDGRGDFRIEHPGAVLHFIKDGFEPQAIVVKPGISHLRVILDPSSNDWMIPVCGKAEHGFRRIGWGKYGIKFPFPIHRMKVKGGKPDIDYVRYVLQPKKGISYMELWFGPYAISTDPDDGLFKASSAFSQRNIGNTSANDAFFGVDSWGHLKSGGNWRQAAIAGMGGAVYRDARPQDAAIFDGIINLMCYVPYPRS